MGMHGVGGCVLGQELRPAWGLKIIMGNKRWRERAQQWVPEVNPSFPVRTVLSSCLSSQTVFHPSRVQQSSQSEELGEPRREAQVEYSPDPKLSPCVGIVENE